jgi:hypothetical protein
MNKGNVFKNIDWLSNYESRVETLRILNIIGSSLTDSGRKAKRELENWITKNADKYLELLNQ